MQKLMAALAFAVGVSTAALAQYTPAPAVPSVAQASSSAPVTIPSLQVQLRS